jgi:mannosyltransferase OCH1-like enzyme
MNRIIQGLWIGSALSVMERMSINSFLSNGHDYHLYTYGEVEGIPAGAVVKDGREILPDSAIFRYTEFDSYAGFANFFRYKLLLEKGGWWVDTDVVCLRPFDFPEDYVFSTEMNDGVEMVTNGIIKAPAGSAAIEFAWRTCEGKKTDQLRWGETGPKLASEAVREFSLERYVKPHDVFCPLGYLDWRRVLTPHEVPEFSASTRAVHLWNEMWRRDGLDKNGRFDAGCLYERLKRKYL